MKSEPLSWNPDECSTELLRERFPPDPKLEALITAYQVIGRISDLFLRGDKSAGIGYSGREMSQGDKVAMLYLPDPEPLPWNPD
ncbi:hypothetical protein HZB02_01085 [Candidatus Woesearchaeota archaeon]|nr:hypothetical protein [Candidatus Woesearchaeota archaeon]